MNELQKSVLAAVADVMADKRQEARIRYHLKKHGLKLCFDRQLGPMVICRTTRLAKVQGTLDQIEAWAKGGAS